MPAEHTVLRIEVSPGLQLLPPSKQNDHAESEEQFEFPRPPAPPKGRYVNRLDLLLKNSELFGKFSSATDGMLRQPIPELMQIPHQRDGHSFYWKTTKPIIPEDAWEFECEEFRHKIGAEEFFFTIGCTLRS